METPFSLITFTEASTLLPGRPHRSTFWRWHRKGVKARNGIVVKLQARRFGGVVYTTREWLDAFGEALTKADTQHFDQRNQPVGQPISPPLARDAKRDEEYLKQSGW